MFRTLSILISWMNSPWRVLPSTMPTSRRRKNSIASTHCSQSSTSTKPSSSARTPKESNSLPRRSRNSGTHAFTSTRECSKMIDQGFIMTSKTERQGAWSAQTFLRVVSIFCRLTLSSILTFQGSLRHICTESVDQEDSVILVSPSTSSPKTISKICSPSKMSSRLRSRAFQKILIKISIQSDK